MEETPTVTKCESFTVKFSLKHTPAKRGKAKYIKILERFGTDKDRGF